MAGAADKPSQSPGQGTRPSLPYAILVIYYGRNSPSNFKTSVLKLSPTQMSTEHRLTDSCLYPVNAIDTKLVYSVE